MSALLSFFWPILGYLFGSVSSAIIVSKLFRLNDPRQVGSGNPGATNVLRSGNKLAAALTLLGDVLKGVIPVLLAKHFDASIAVISMVAIAAFMGHLFPVFFGFKGGKGVATALGIFATLHWQLLVVFSVAWLAIAATTRYSSLSALIAGGITGISSFAIFNQPHELQLIGAVFWIIAFLFQRHRDNINRLKSGTESKIGQKQTI